MRNASQSRRDPQDRLNGIFKIRGVTAIELMVVLAAAIAVTSLAIPSWHGVREREQFIQGAQELALFISHARTESIMRGRLLSVSYHRSDANQWCLGLSEGAGLCDCTNPDPSASSACQVDSVGRVFTQSSANHPGILDRLIGDGAFTFDPASGFLVDTEDMAEMVLISDSGRYSLSVKVYAGGEVKVCSEHSGTRVPGFDLC